MAELTGGELLALWEEGAEMHPLDRGLLALRAGYRHEPSEGFADWPVGRRNQALAALRCASFGPELQAVVTCPGCGEALEFSFDAGVIAAPAAAAAPVVTAAGLSFRLPTSRDLAGVAGYADARRAALALVEACCLDTPGFWPDAVVEQAGEALAAADPMAETRLELDCPACGERWADNLDIEAFYWNDVDAAARSLMATVHALAAAYGWAERDILALSEVRRAAYVAMAGR
jgi:predicted RNA-binding Zn-ribbon protein involved in translation (DUF1610 family)